MIYPVKGLLRGIIFFLILGVLVNILIAWGCAVGVAVHKRDPHGPAIAVQTIGDPAEMCFYEMRRVGAARRVQWHVDDYSPPVVDDSRGWPMLALSCRIHTMTDTADCYAVDVEGGIGIAHLRDAATITPARGVLPSEPDFYFALVLPCRPMWPGFVLNTLMYAAILWLLLRGVPAVRRAVRAFNGRCTNCGYDLRGCGGAVCPECGWPRPAHPAH